MWVLKFEVLDENNPMTKLKKESGIVLSYYPLKKYSQNNRTYFVALANMKGSSRNKERFVGGLKNLNDSGGRRLELLEQRKDTLFVITSISNNSKELDLLNIAYDQSLIHIKPVIWVKDDWEHWEIASLERKNIENLIVSFRKHFKFRLRKFSEERIDQLSVITALPSLSPNQKKIIELAVEEGYYEYPRKTTLRKLGELSGIKFSTVQEHLRKAENKLIPFLMSNIE